jgi:S1-C subfamily serine protease
VIDGATKITITFSGNKQYSANVIGQDHDLDLAVLKIDANEQFPVLSLGDSNKMRVGEWVVAIGNPYGLDHTVTDGLVSAKGRPMKIEDRNYTNLIQTDAAINPGNSGGPLLNLSGEVIGINTAVNVEAQGIGFAIPINTAKDVLNDLIGKGKIAHPYLGVNLQSMDNNLAAYMGIPIQGALVVTVIQGSPAYQAGIQQYDVIISIDNENITDADSLLSVLKSKKVGDIVNLGIIRNRQTISASVTLGNKP